jgi:hypothetical protein
MILLPYPDYTTTALHLDDVTLGFQIANCLKVLKYLDKNGTFKHPLGEPWRGHASSLAMHGMILCEYWISRGQQDALGEEITQHLTKRPVPPKWLGDAAIHRSHKSHLLRIDLQHYRKFWPKLPDNLPLVWE